MEKLKIKIFIIILLLSLIFATFPSVFAKSDEDEINIPDEWIGKNKVVIPHGKLTLIVFIKYDKPIKKITNDQTVLGDPDNDGNTDAYKLLGIKWNLAKYPSGVPYIVNPSVPVKQGLKENDVVDEIKYAFESWDMAVDLDRYSYNYVSSKENSTTNKVELYNNIIKVDYKAKVSQGRPDYKNVVTWAKMRSGVIAVTYIWYTTTNEIIDADVAFNSNYKWGIDKDAEGPSYSLNPSNANFDICDIASHETGHFTGLDDLYDSNYSAMTMYGYASYKEVYKVTLEPGDIAGAQEIY